MTKRPIPNPSNSDPFLEDLADQVYRLLRERYRNPFVQVARINKAITAITLTDADHTTTPRVLYVCVEEEL